jgi:hypothetical protein
MATYQILYWHDIPLQVRARGEGGRASVPLPDRFQAAVDLAAMAADLVGSDDYSAALRWGDTQERPGSAQSVAAEVAAELDQQYASIDWRSTATALRQSPQETESLEQ